MGTGRAAGVNGEARFVPRPPGVIVGCMSTLVPVDSVDIQILVDNVTDSLSSAPSFVETELAGLGRRRGAAWVLGGACLCCAAHGLSCLLTIRAGDKVHTVLFDTGPEDRTFEQNVSRLGVVCRYALPEVTALQTGPIVIGQFANLNASASISRNRRPSDPTDW